MTKYVAELILGKELAKESDKNVTSRCVSLNELLRIGEAYKICSNGGLNFTISTCDKVLRWTGTVTAFSEIGHLDTNFEYAYLVCTGRIYAFKFDAITARYTLIKDEPYWEIPKIGFYYKIIFDKFRIATVKTSPISELDRRYKVKKLSYDAAIDKTYTLWLEGDNNLCYVFMYDEQKEMWKFKYVI